MRLNQNIKYREADKVLRDNGYTKFSCSGSHFKYKNGSRSIVVPKNLNPVIWQRLCKENQLTF